MQHLTKLCADSLRTFIKERHGIKLKASHAHELIASYFGYNSRAALLADTQHPINNLKQAEIIVMITDTIIDKRRKELKELPSELPDSYTIGEAVYSSLFSDEWWGSEYPPFRSFDKLAGFLIENNDAYQNVFKFYCDIPMHHFVEVKNEENSVILRVLYSHRISTGEMLGAGRTTINLQRVAGRIGFGKPQISVEKWTGGTQKVIKPVVGAA